MNTTNRQATILQWLERDGQVQVRDLVDHFQVSEMTIRRDLEHLAQKGKLVRTYGGAVPVSGLIREQPYATKAAERTAEKERIARRAVELVRDGDMVLLDAGSTTAAFAKLLHGKKDLTVITPDLLVAMALCDDPSIRVMVTGGTVQHHGYNLIGPFAEQTLRALTADIAFLGSSSMDVEYGLTTPTLEKVPLKQAILRAARRSVLLADATKFGLRSSFQICPLSALSHIISDVTLPPDVARSIRKGGVELDLV